MFKNYIIILAVFFFSGVMQTTCLFGETLEASPSTKRALPSEKFQLTLGVGASLWGFDSHYIIELNPEFDFKIPLTQGLLTFDITLPVFMAMIYEKDANQNDVFQGIQAYFRGFSSKDYGTTVWPEMVSPAAYLVTYIKEVSWKTDNLLLAITPDTPDINPGLQNILWYNPFFDGNTGILNRYPQFQFTSGKNVGAVYSSSLTNPSLLFSYYRFFPFLNISDEFIRGWSFTPSLWTDLGVVKNPDFGAALETSTGGIGNDFVRLKFSTDGHLFSSRNIPAGLLYRIGAGGSLQFRPVGFYAGYINKSTRHPFGPYLSPLYVGRGQNDYQAYSKNHGILVGLLPGIDSTVNFGLDAEIYPDNPMNFSIKGQLRVKWEKSSFGLAYIHEDIVDLKDFLEHRADNSAFIEFHLQYYLLPDTLFIEWRHVVSFRDYSSVKTLVSLMAYF